MTPRSLAWMCSTTAKFWHLESTVGKTLCGAFAPGGAYHGVEYEGDEPDLADRCPRCQALLERIAKLPPELQVGPYNVIGVAAREKAVAMLTDPVARREFLDKLAKR
jgi:hypothetical protein